jgi:hypothetical protein
MSRARERESRRSDSRGGESSGEIVQVRRASSCGKGRAAGSKGQRRIQLYTIKYAQCASIIQRVQSEIHKRFSRKKREGNKPHTIKSQASQLLPVAQVVGGKPIQLEAVRKRIKNRRDDSKNGFGLGVFFNRISRKAFIPENVTPDYWSYVRWRFIQRISAAMLSVYSTDCMLRAVGVGAKRSLPTAAAFNWLLKDGIGKLGKLAIVARLGSQYDLELKKFRFLSTFICDVSCGLEMLTPFSPKNFLLLASLGNMGKSVGLSIALATQPAFHKKFALADNMADITAKSQAQHVVADTIGLGLALGMSHFAAGVSPQMRAALPIVSFPFLAALDVFLVHNEIRAIDLKTLNRDRSQVLSSHWIQNKCVLGMRKVSRVENMAFLPFSPEGKWPLKVESLSSAIGSDIDLLGSYLECYHKEGYMLIPRVKQIGPFTTRRSLSLAYGSSASERDMLKGILQASYFRMLEEKQEQGSNLSGSYTDVLKKSKVLAEQNVRHFMKDVASRGWQTSPLLLFDSGYPAYVVKPDWRKWAKAKN